VKLLKIITMLLIVVAGASVTESAVAQRHGGARIGLGITFGFPLYAPGYYAPLPYYYPAPYYYPPWPYYYSPILPPAPQAYIEQGGSQASPDQPQGYWWYYCQDSKAYYPYVKECPGGWQRVSPQPPPG